MGNLRRPYRGDARRYAAKVSSRPRAVGRSEGHGRDHGGGRNSGCRACDLAAPSRFENLVRATSGSRSPAQPFRGERVPNSRTSACKSSNSRQPQTGADIVRAPERMEVNSGHRKTADTRTLQSGGVDRQIGPRRPFNMQLGSQANGHGPVSQYRHRPSSVSNRNELGASAGLPAVRFRTTARPRRQELSVLASRSSRVGFRPSRRPPTVTARTLAYVQQAVVLIQAEDQALLDRVLAGKLPLEQAAGQVRKLVKAVSDFRVLTSDGGSPSDARLASGPFGTT